MNDQTTSLEAIWPLCLTELWVPFLPVTEHFLLARVYAFGFAFHFAEPSLPEPEYEAAYSNTKHYEHDKHLG